MPTGSSVAEDMLHPAVKSENMQEDTLNVRLES